MPDLYSNMCMLDYWSLKMALDTVVTYKMMNMSHKTLDAYQSHESGYYTAVCDQFYERICADEDFVDVAEYYEYPTFEDGTADLSPQDRKENWLHWGKSRISPLKFITWCKDNNFSVPDEFEKFIQDNDPDVIPDKDYIPKILPITVTEDTDLGKDTISSTLPKESKYVFKNMNHFWKAVYNGKETHVKDSLGMKYIFELIKCKGELIDWLSLSNAVKGVHPDYVAPGTADEDVSVGFISSQGKVRQVYAGKDKKALQIEMLKLNEQYDEAMEFGHDDKADDLQGQIDNIQKYIFDTYRPDGTLKENSGNYDNSVNSIKAAIKRALDDIENGLPDLRKHLYDTIVLNWQRSNPSYSPAIDIDWEL